MNIKSLIRNKFFLFFCFFIFFFSFFFNKKYANIGVFPIDTFYHFDSALGILNGKIPIRDYWIVSGLAVDYLQSFFFLLFGVFWNSYTFHSSLFNGLLSVATFFYLNIRGLNIFLSFIYSIFFSVLAYPISGVPFLDFHAVFFCLLAFYLISISFYIKKPKFIWCFVSFFLLVSFLSKQVPVAYFVLILFFLSPIYLKYKNDYSPFFFISISSLIYVLLICVYFFFYEISFKDFYYQYIKHPLTIGNSRLENLEIRISTFFNKFKFILIPLFLNIILILNKIKKKNFEDFFSFLVFLALVLCFLYYQILTKNQILIYFLTTLSFAILHIEILKKDFVFKKTLSTLTLFFVLFVTLKYHYEFNEKRKFHDLQHRNLKDSISAGLIDSRLDGLMWLNREYNDPIKEIEILRLVKNKILVSEKKFFLVSHYKFLDSVTNSKIYYLARSYTLDNASFPIANNSSFEKYKEYLANLIKRKYIDEVYFIRIEKIDTAVITDYFDKNCYEILYDEIFIKIKMNIECLNYS